MLIQYIGLYCGPKGVLIIEVPLYRSVYCGPKGVLITEASCTPYTLYSTKLSWLATFEICMEINFEGWSFNGYLPNSAPTIRGTQISHSRTHP